MSSPHGVTLLCLHGRLGPPPTPYPLMGEGIPGIIGVPGGEYGGTYGGVYGGEYGGLYGGVRDGGEPGGEYGGTYGTELGVYDGGEYGGTILGEGLPLSGVIGGGELTNETGYIFRDGNDCDGEFTTDGDDPIFEGTLLDGLAPLGERINGEPRANGIPIKDEPMFEITPLEYDENASGILTGLPSYLARISDNVSVRILSGSPVFGLFISE